MLVSWIPPLFVEAADHCVYVNPEQCIRWAADVDRPLFRALKSLTLVGEPPAGGWSRQRVR